MGRFLFVVPPIAERVRPTVAVGSELVAHGHQVAWTGHREGLGDAPDGATVVPVGSLRNPTDLILLWNDFLLPLARTMLPTVHAAVEDFRPDVIVTDPHALAGAAVAHLSGLPWATVVPNSAGLADPLGDLPRIEKRLRRQTRAFFREAGLDELAAARIDPQASPHLVLACTTTALAGPTRDWPGRGRHELVGPCLDPPPDDTVFDLDRLDLSRLLGFSRSRPLVVVALESRVPHAYHGARLHRAVIDALSTMAVQVVVVGHPALVADVPTGAITMPLARLPTLARHAAAIVCDGGHDTVCTALANAVPLVVAPLTGDQPIIADQVVRAAAGVRVPARSADPARLRRALATVLTDVRIRRGVHRARASFTTAPGPPAAAHHLESLLGRSADAPVLCGRGQDVG